MILEKEKKKKGLPFFIGVGVLALCVIVIAIVVIKNIYDDIQFKNSLPDAEAAPLMYYMSITGADYFYNEEYVSVLIPDADYQASYISTLQDKSLDILILKGSGELYVNMLSSFGAYPIGTIFIPSGIRKEYKVHLKELFPESEFIEADKIERVVIGDYVFYFSGDKHSINTKIQYGTHSFLIADSECGSRMNKMECDVAVMPYQAYVDSHIESEYVFFEENAVVNNEDILEKTIYYATHPGSTFFGICMHRFEGQEDNIIFNIETAATGKIKEQ